MGGPQKYFRKSRFFKNGAGGGVDNMAVTFEPGNRFTIRLKFWKLEKKVAGPECDNDRVPSAPSG